MAHIQTITIAMKGDGQASVYEPPARVLRVSVVGNEAFLSVHEPDGPDQHATEPVFEFSVHARALLRAVRVGIEDAADHDDDINEDVDELPDTSA